MDLADLAAMFAFFRLTQKHSHRPLCIRPLAPLIRHTTIYDAHTKRHLE